MQCFFWKAVYNRCFLKQEVLVNLIFLKVAAVLFCYKTEIVLPTANLLNALCSNSISLLVNIKSLNIQHIK